jgi:afadin
MRRLARIAAWAEKQGLELAADCHLSRVLQGAHLLQQPKTPDNITGITAECFKLNSLQLRPLLENYTPTPAVGENWLPQEVIQHVVNIAQSTADELFASEGRPLRREEDPDLQLPFLLPEDGYSRDILRGFPNGFSEFLEPMIGTGLVRLTMHPNASGLWTVHMISQPIPPEATPFPAGTPPGAPVIPPGNPEITTVTFQKTKVSSVIRGTMLRNNKY